MNELLFGTTLLASFLGGVVALLAPCCVSVMLPAYLATGFRHRGGVVPATLVFAGGVAAVILPIGLGATAVSRLLIDQHVLVFSLGAALMVIGGVAVLGGWSPRLPMPRVRGGADGSFASAFALGGFSGAASACCAPVLAGVAVLSGAAGSFPAALAIGVAYVSGMVAPLCVIALVWDKRRERAARLLTGREVRLRIGSRQHRLPLGNALSGLLLIAMGLLAGLLAITGPAMPNEGWQVQLSASLQHTMTTILGALSWVPGWLVAAALLAGGVLLIARARHARSTPSPETSAARSADETTTRVEELPSGQQDDR